MLALRIATSLGSLLLGCTLFTACNNPKTTGSTQATGEDSLPAPAAQGGSVTGMPDPGVATPQPAPIDTNTPAEDSTAVTDAGAQPDTGTASDTTPASNSPAAVPAQPSASTTNAAPKSAAATESVGGK